MHEVGVMQSALEIALEQAGRQGASRIDCIALRVGMLSGVVPEALEFAFDVVARGTIAEGGRLVVERVPILCVCAGCGAEFRADDLIFDCPHCRTARRPSAARARAGTRLPGGLLRCVATADAARTSARSTSTIIHMNTHDRHTSPARPRRPRRRGPHRAGPSGDPVEERSARGAEPGRLRGPGPLRPERALLAGLRQDRAAAADPRGPRRSAPRRGDRGGPGDRQRRPADPLGRGAGGADHDGQRLPPRGGDGGPGRRRRSTWTTSTCSSSRTWGTWSARPPTTWGRPSGWSCSP